MTLTTGQAARPTPVPMSIDRLSAWSNALQYARVATVSDVQVPYTFAADAVATTNANRSTALPPYQARPSRRDPLYNITSHLALPTVIESGDARIRVAEEILHIFHLYALRE